MPAVVDFAFVFVFYILLHSWWNEGSFHALHRKFILVGFDIFCAYIIVEWILWIHENYQNL